MFGKKPSDEVSLSKIRSGVEEFEKCVERKQEKLEDMFMTVKKAILNSQSLNLDHVHILRKQVRHILSVARAIDDRQLEETFEHEQTLLAQIQDLFEQYPSLEVANSADLQASLQNLRNMLESQQRMIFSHKEILTHEKRRLVQILQEAHGLEEDLAHEHDHLQVSQEAILH